MTDSTIDENAGDGTLEIGPSVEELFGPLEESRDSRDDAVDSHPPETELSALESRVDEIADRTAEDAFEQFEQFRSEVDGEYDVDGVLADESPEEIIASADEEDDTDVLGDEDGLEDLLLTGRQAGSEFLWVDTDAEDDSSSEPSVSASGETENGELTDELTTDAGNVDDNDAETGDAEADDHGMATDAEEAADHEEKAETTGAHEDGSSGLLRWLRAKLGL